MPKIKSVDLFPVFCKLKRPYGDANGWKTHRAALLIRIRTESGITGWGEAVDWLPALVPLFENRIVPELTGLDARQIQTAVQQVAKWNQRAASAVSMALTEIAAKQAGCSVCEWWGGEQHAQVPVYASYQSYAPDAQWERLAVDRVLAAYEAGFRQFKVKVGGKTLEEDQRHIRLLLGELPAGVRLAIDANESYDAATTKAWIPLLAQSDGWMWFEEPMPVKHASAYSELKQQLPVPVAGGENIARPEEFLPLLQQRAFDIIQPDPMHLGGIETYRHMLSMARTHGLRVSPHTFDGALSRHYAVLAQACLPAWSKMEGEELEPVEWDAMENPLGQLLSVKPNHGHVTISGEPGIGADVDEQLLQSLRWDGSAY
ncbi:mandelate racemase/muconate lactonizing enzyme family protein [Xylanibacillus composti]|uniref:Putative isomerase YitF n=1 Tax=Xylanibacillus composti TaxID=1572762 RepID=A0A8J4H316_9BACL|nr:mandelate racemase/muconate lactonizing enzyme family protein [Xylanibacillus composti]MDT9723417.1 mandelate racemase/muconate lactonizing enzyme family protein [Xylanibacillus composti]GIQ68547.1 putative isomerase YitF [Xylanibacillus composti]